MGRIYTSIGEAKIALEIAKGNKKDPLKYRLVDEGIKISDGTNNANIRILCENYGVSIEEIEEYKNSKDYKKIRIARDLLLNKVLGEFGTIDTKGNRTIVSASGHLYSFNKAYDIIKRMIDKDMFREPYLPDQREIDALYAIIGYCLDTDGDVDKVKNLIECMLKGVPNEGEITSRGKIDQYVNRTPAKKDNGIIIRDTLDVEVEGALLARRLFNALPSSRDLYNNQNGKTIKDRYNAVVEELPVYINQVVKKELSIKYLNKKWLDASRPKSVYYTPLIAIYNHYINEARMRQRVNDGKCIIGSFEDEKDLARAIIRNLRNRVHSYEEAGTFGTNTHTLEEATNYIRQGVLAEKIPTTPEHPDFS